MIDQARGVRNMTLRAWMDEAVDAHLEGGGPEAVSPHTEDERELVMRTLRVAREGRRTWATALRSFLDAADPDPVAPQLGLVPPRPRGENPEGKQ
jgi:hypothetical protein